MIIRRDLEQGSAEWAEARAGIPTASEFDALVSPVKWEIRSGEGPKSYLARKLAEKWSGGPLWSATAFAQDQGTILEGEAIPFLEFEHGLAIERVGFITDDQGLIGCSPDCFSEQGKFGVEVKCPAIETHVRYLLDGHLPSEYSPQVYGSMLVTGFSQWKFVSYRRQLPPLMITVERDDKKMQVLQDALGKFKMKFDLAWERLLEINGGPPPVREKMVFSNAHADRYNSDPNEVPT